jgi:hypothetical protein
LQFWNGLKKAIEVETPILFITQGGLSRELYDYKYLGISGNHSKKNITWNTIDHTNHMLVSGGGKEKVTKYIQDWVLKLSGNQNNTTERG